MANQESYAITGIPVESGTIIPVRREVDEWYNDNSRQAQVQVSLFILALQQFQNISYKDKLSYFQIAGIHHEPVVTWDEKDPPKPNPNGGYCVHNNVTFPTWHRPYMLVYEQRLYELMRVIVKETVPAEHKPEWENAASQWRLPYWDFAKGIIDSRTRTLGVPVLCTKDMVDILDPSKPLSTITVPNPVYKFTAETLMGELDDPFKIPPEEIDDTGKNFYPWDKCKSTTKYGLMKDSASTEDAGQDVKKSNLALNEHPWYRDNKAPYDPLESLTYEVHRLFSFKFSNWGAFASTKYFNRDNPRKIPAAQTMDILSLEFIHNNVHNWVGGTDYLRSGDERFWGAGHMSSIGVASFDPIFYLYHCNVDRLTAIWQVLNPDHWFDKPQQGDPLPVDALTPFHVDTKYKYFTSNDTQSWRKLGYDYDTVKQPGTNKDRSISDVKKLINELYGQPALDVFGDDARAQDDYVINVIYDRYALNGIPYTIVFYFEFEKFRKIVGGVYNFSTKLRSAHEGGCDNCVKQKNEGVLSAAQVSLTYTLHKGKEWHGFNSLKPENIVPLIRNRLRWVILGNDNTVKFESHGPPAAYPTWESLKVIPSHGTISYPTRDGKFELGDLPSYGHYDHIDLA
ncbi:common central domain of tyrosinase-domain-containing protein [Aspergillus alliaceus]|uniref:tyrosinase n=1 Tax=Petromyces alliaceus TaxID=209559 RepID=A0A5N7CI82_PETAA|nr:common central domain of tyrosinase-domain-containing protein [Aspergillus alliaceus]